MMNLVAQIEHAVENYTAAELALFWSLLKPETKSKLDSASFDADLFRSIMKKPPTAVVPGQEAVMFGAMQSAMEFVKLASKPRPPAGGIRLVSSQSQTSLQAHPRQCVHEQS